MKYNNPPAKPLGEEEMLHFLQQSSILADRMREMLYSVQDFVCEMITDPYNRRRMNREIHATTAAARKQARNTARSPVPSQVQQGFFFALDKSSLCQDEQTVFLVLTGCHFRYSNRLYNAK
jgi:hypothetical protein